MHASETKVVRRLVVWFEVGDIVDERQKSVTDQGG